MKKIQTNKINFELLVQALGINNIEDAYKFMNDGRIMGRLGDIYVLTNKDIRGFNATIGRISKTLGGNIKFLQD